MKPRRIDEDVWWVGAVDWDRRLFDSLIPLPDGTSYNSYFVQGKTHSALVDAVDPSMASVLFSRLKHLGIEKIDYIIANHLEQDHSGAIPDLLQAYPMAKVIVSDKGKQLAMSLLNIREDLITTVRDGEFLDLGEKLLQFIYFPWVHWPETMVTWIPQQKILFSCDLFGSHLATSDLFLQDESLILEPAKRYYAEIMMPFKTAIQKNLDKMTELAPLIIGPSHGPMYKNAEMIINAYREWTSGPLKSKIVIPYISMHNSTRLMVEYFVEACATRGLSAEQFNLADSDIGKLAMSFVDASGIVFGSPMVLGGLHPKVAFAALLANAIQPRAKMISGICSYGWGGKFAESLQSLVAGLKPDFIQPVLAKGLPGARDYAALDELAESLKTRILQSTAPMSSKTESKYLCPLCKYIYDPKIGDPDGGIPAGTPFEKIPDNWVCPLCGAAKSMFQPIEQTTTA